MEVCSGTDHVIFSSTNQMASGRACKLLQTTKGSTATSCPVTRAYQTSNTEACMRASTIPDDCVITLSVADVSNSFKQVNSHKAAGPDGFPGRMLQACADQLAGVVTDIFNMFLIESVIPTCFKQPP